MDACLALRPLTCGIAAGAAAGSRKSFLFQLSLVELTVSELEAALERKRNNEQLADEADRYSRDLFAFLRAGWHVLEPATQFYNNWHIGAICEKLEACRHGQIDRLVINIPPRHMKTLIVTAYWPAWRWTFEPTVKFLTASHSWKKSEEGAVLSRDIITSKWYQARWPEVQLKGDSNQKSHYTNTATGYRLATHPEGGTGDGGDIIIIDDPHQAARIHSAADRASVIRWHGNTISSRFNDPKTGVEVLIMQRLHEEDLTGVVLEQGGWEHLCLPAEYEPNHPFVWPDDPRTEPGELLWEERFPKVSIERMAKDMTAQVAAGQLQQRPAPAEGDMLKRAHWRYYDPRLSFYSPSRFGVEEVAQLRNQIGRFTMVVHSWDTSLKSGLENDYVAGGIWGIRGPDAYLLRLSHKQMGLNATIESMVELSDWATELWPDVAQYVVIETAANGKDAIAEMKRRVTGVVEYTVRDAKEIRAMAAAPALESGNCFVPGYGEADGSGYTERTDQEVQKFIEECALFPNGAHDDQVDQWSQMVNWVRARGPQQASVWVPEGQI